MGIIFSWIFYFYFILFYFSFDIISDFLFSQLCEILVNHKNFINIDILWFG